MSSPDGEAAVADIEKVSRLRISTDCLEALVVALKLKCLVTCLVY